MKGRAGQALAVVFAAVAMAAICTPSVSAEVRPYESQLTGVPNGAGAVQPGPFTAPWGVAIDGTDNIWVADRGPGLVDKFDSSGNFLLQKKSVALWDSNYGRILAFGNTSGHLYIADSNLDDVWVLDSSGNFVTKIVGSPFGGGCCYVFVAVDNSGGATDGTVFVSSNNGTVSRLDSDGNPVNFSGSASYIAGNKLTGTPSGAFGGGIFGIATDSHGNIYALDTANQMVFEFDSSGLFLREFAETPGAAFESITAVAVDPTTDNILIADGGDHQIHEFDSTGNFLHNITGEDSPTGMLGSVSALAVDSTGRVYVAGGTDSPVVNTFGPFLEFPKVIYGPPTKYAATSLTLNATIDPDGGGTVMGCHVEFGPDTSYGSTAPCSPAAPYGSPSAVTADISGLPTENTYHYRFVVENTNGIRRAADRQFTLHAVADLNTQPATSVGPVTARLNGSFTGNGDNTHYYFDFGTTASYGSRTKVPPGDDAGSNLGPQGVGTDVQGLQPETPYHFRIVAINSEGTSFGQDETFTTPVAVEDVVTGAATDVNPDSVHVSGSFSGNGQSAHYYFDYGTDTFYGTRTAIPPGNPVGATTGTTSVAADIAGLIPITTYHYRVAVTNDFGTTVGQDEEFTTPPGPPTIEQWSLGVHADSAVLHSRINPRGADTTYHFEWGTDDCGASVCNASTSQAIGGGLEDKTAFLPLTGLVAGTIYHYRVVASNSVGTTEGQDRTFMTFPTSASLDDPCPNAQVRQQTSAALVPDCRAYELVSVRNAGGYDVTSDLIPGQTPYSGYPRAVDPSRVLYSVHFGAIPGIAGTTNFARDPYVATRGGNGWETKYVGLSSTETPSNGPFSSEVDEPTSKLDSFVFGGGENICDPCFADGKSGLPMRTPNGQLVQGMAGSMDPGAATSADILVRKRFSADGRFLVFGSTSQFEPDAVDGSPTIYLRDLEVGTTKVVSKTPGGTNIACLASCGTKGVAGLDISTDGSRVLVGQLTGVDADGNDHWHPYMNVGGATTTIDLAPGTTSGVSYAGMNSDGTKVFFTSPDQLTGDDSDTSVDLFRADVGASLATLTRVSSGTAGTSNIDACDPAGNSGGSRWNSVDATASCSVATIAGIGGVATGDASIYFLSPEKLDGASNGSTDEPNLYISRPGFAPRFVATLEAENPAVLNAVHGTDQRHTGEFQLTTSGDVAAFPSRLPLTGYDNDGHSEVFRYDNLADSLDCVSCPVSGARATGDATLAAYGSSLTDDGRVFFISSDPIAPNDLSDRTDIYEWKDGAAGMVSTGISAFSSSLLSVSADGTDVYFYTRDTLVPEDLNGQTVKIYDARALGGFLAGPPPVPCQASDECHGPGTKTAGPPDIGTFLGTGGNVTPQKKCGGGKVRKRGRCVKRKPPRAKKRANRNRGND